MLKGLYAWAMGLAAHPRALWLLALLAFVESSVFPLPPDALLIPMVLAARARAFRIALVCTLASVVGGLAGYGLGALLFDSVGRPLIEFYGYADAFTRFERLYREWGAWIVAAGGLTPIPYKVVTIASGLVRLDLPTFVLVSALSRGARFFIEAALLWYLGPPIRAFVERYLGGLAVVAFLLLVAGFLVVGALA